MEFKTTDQYWDCECKDNYINRSDKETVCPICGATREDMPDSRIDEVWKHWINKMKETFRYGFGLKNLNGGDVQVKITSRKGWEHSTTSIRGKIRTGYLSDKMEWSDWSKFVLSFDGIFIIDED